jgi:hypothetical protein
MELSSAIQVPATFLPGNNPTTHWKGGWLGPRDSLDVLEKRKFFFPLNEF